MTTKQRKNRRQFGLFVPEPTTTVEQIPTRDKAVEVLIELLLEAAGVTPATTQGGGDEREDHR